MLRLFSNCLPPNSECVVVVTISYAGLGLWACQCHDGAGVAKLRERPELFRKWANVKRRAAVAGERCEFFPERRIAHRPREAAGRSFFGHVERSAVGVPDRDMRRLDQCPDVDLDGADFGTKPPYLRITYRGIAKFSSPGRAAQQADSHGMLGAHLRLATGGDIGPVGAGLEQGSAAHDDFRDPLD